ncbi:MAG: iron-sulfur cluster-binding domain-containing protein [Myxococcota bacterium]
MAYLCGPGSMIDEVSQGLASLGVPDERVRFERFDTGARHGPAEDHGPGTKTPAAPSVGGGEVEVEVVLDGHRRRFTMAAGQSVIEAGAEAGVELPWSCGGGMCSTCRCRLVAGEAEMKLNYSLEPWELERGYVLACQSMPKSERLVLDFDEQ